MTTNRGPVLRVVRRGDGYAAWGPGFYVWREDAGELLRDAAALAGAQGGAGADHDPRRARASSASRRKASIAAR